MTRYLKIKTIDTAPRLPLEGSLDITYRCNNNCLHCWLRIPENAPERTQELTFPEIREIVEQARSMGCRQWNISGGEPMLRPDFSEIFETITARSTKYTINTNGTLITPEIARLMKRPGVKLVALYGATRETYDRVTRHPDGFDMAMQGIRYLKEAGAGFTVQLIPMTANWHEWDQMKELARSLSPHTRVGAPWLYLSACGSETRNREIAAQRLPAPAVLELDRPDPGYEERCEERYPAPEKVRERPSGDDRLFKGCIDGKSGFHVDPYGGMTFCGFIKDPDLRCDLRRTSFREAWDVFIPSLAEKIRGGEEWRENCGSCLKRDDCRWCAVYGYLETGRYPSPVPYLCGIAGETRNYRETWLKNHRRYFQIAGITVRVESDVELTGIRFSDALMRFTADGPGDDNVTIRHRNEMPDFTGMDLGRELYRKPPWSISCKNGVWTYREISPEPDGTEPHLVAVFSDRYRRAVVYTPPEQREIKRTYGWTSLSGLATDQIWLAPLLADRNAVLLHAAGVILNGSGLCFVGHSGAGKSTVISMLKEAAARRGLVSRDRLEILCDDRIVVRKWKEGWRLHGTWSHGDVPDVSPASAPVRAVLFLQKADCDELVPRTDRKENLTCLLATLIRPMTTAEWWERELDVLTGIVEEIPLYTMRFNRSGEIVKALARLTPDPERLQSMRDTMARIP